MMAGVELRTETPKVLLLGRDNSDVTTARR
jgi:hypothetical protein